jgi:hypothetical protein
MNQVFNKKEIKRLFTNGNIWFDTYSLHIRDLRFSRLSQTSALKMEATRSSKMLLTSYKKTRRNNSEDHNQKGLNSAIQS